MRGFYFALSVILMVDESIVVTNDPQKAKEDLHFV